MANLVFKANLAEMWLIHFALSALAKNVVLTKVYMLNIGLIEDEELFSWRAWQRSCHCGASNNLLPAPVTIALITPTWKE